MDFKGFKLKILLDLKRYSPNGDNLLRFYLTSPGFRYIFWLRLAAYRSDRKRSVIPFCRLILKAFLIFYFMRYGASISPRASIGPGLFIGDPEGIIIGPGVFVGANCTLQKNVSINKTRYGSNAGVPVVRDNVFIGEGARIIGGIEVGNNVTIGSSGVVMKDVSDNLTVMTLPDFLGMR